MKTLYLFTIALSGVLTVKYDVKYPDNPICAVRGFSVSIPCSYLYPTQNPIIQVTQKLWCSMNSNTGRCTGPPYVYNSKSNTKSDFEYVGDDKSNCTLLIHNVQFSYSGEYKFRFITTNSKCTGNPGAILQVADLKVSLIRLSGNGTLKQGDALNLTCDVNCAHSSSQFVWSKNNERLPASGPVLHFLALTVRDSGNYTCTWETNVTSGSDTISLQVEGEEFVQRQIWIFVLVIGVVTLVTVGAVIYHRRKRKEAQEENSGKRAEKTQVGENTDDKQAKPQLNHALQLDDETLHKEDVTYVTLCVQDKKVKQERVPTEQQKEDDRVIYSTVINT